MSSIALSSYPVKNSRRRSRWRRTNLFFPLASLAVITLTTVALIHAIEGLPWLWWLYLLFTAAEAGYLRPAVWLLAGLLALGSWQQSLLGVYRLRAWWQWRQGR